MRSCFDSQSNALPELKYGLDHNFAPPVIPAGCRNLGPWTVSLSIGLLFSILALGPAGYRDDDRTG